MICTYLLKRFLHQQILFVSKQLFYIEPFMRGNQHAPFNAAMLQVLQCVYPEAAVTLWCSPDHLLALKEQSPLSAQVTHKPLNVPALSAANKIRWIYKHAAECWVLTKLLIQAHRDAVNLVYFAFLSPPAQWLLSCYRVFFFKKCNIFVQLHGLELLKSSAQNKAVDRLYAWLLRNAFRRKRSGLYYIVLERRAQSYLQEKQLIPPAHLLYIPHPYLFPPPLARQKSANVVTFVHLGVARLSKGSQHFFELAKQFKEEIAQRKLIFQVVGHLLPEMAPYVNSYVVYPKKGEMLPLAVYQEALASADYALFCYGTDSYELTGSGALMDAIAARKPILGLRNPSFSEIFAIVAQPPGVLFDTLEEMEQYIRSIIHLKTPSQTDREVAFKMLQEHFGVANVAEELRIQLKRVLC